MSQPISSGGPSVARRRVVGVPRACWCGAGIMTMLSRSERNPFRRYYRCAYAVSSQIYDSTHLFKWIDNSLVEEVETLHNEVDRVENQVMEHLENTLLNLAENFIMDKVEYLLMDKVNKLVKEKVGELVKDKIEEIVKEKVEEVVKDKLDEVVQEKLEKLALEKLDNLVMEKVQEELLCMKLT